MKFQAVYNSFCPKKNILKYRFWINQIIGKDRQLVHQTQTDGHK